MKLRKTVIAIFIIVALSGTKLTRQPRIVHEVQTQGECK